MIHTVKIGGREIGLAWNQSVASRFQFRASKIGGSPSISDFTNPKKAAAAVTSFLWLILPPDALALYPSPEDLFVVIDSNQDEAESIHSALVAVIADMTPDDEKKSTLKKPRSQK